MARQQPWRKAVVYPQARDPQGRMGYTHLTYRQLDQESDRLAWGFQKIGIQRGTRVALMVPPSLDFFTLTFALFKLGAIPVLIDPGIGPRSLGQGLGEAEPSAFIGISRAHLARAVLGWARKSISIKVTVGGRALTGGYTLNEVNRRGNHAEPFPLAIPQPGETAAILFTSGSTGPAKGVVYTHECFGGQVDQIRRLYGIEPGEVDLPTFPLFALFGPALGMTSILPEMDPTRPAEVDPAKILEAIENFGVTNMFGSPALLNRVGRYGQEHGIRMPTLRRVISAGAPVSAKVLERFASLLPPGAQVFTPYGATECLPVASIGSDEVLKETRFLTDQGRGVCVGLPVPGVTVKIIRISDEPIPTWDVSLEQERGLIGEIAVKAPHATRSYYNRPEATGLAKIPDPVEGGFYHRMGDLGYLDDRGRIWFCGRKSHRVATKSGVLFTIPCEAIFNTHPAVYRSALVGVPHGEGMEPVLCVELEREFVQTHHGTLKAELEAMAARHPHTRSIRTFLVHPKFPVDIRHNAKIFREQLAVWASKQLR